MTRTYHVILWIVLITLSAIWGSWTSFTLAATTVTNVYDQPSSLKVSTSSNHKIVFTASEAVDEGETLVLTFDPAFTTSTLTEDDVDIDDDGIDLTTAATCTGTEQASVSVVSGVVTFTICTGDGGAIASGSVVTIEIGTTATASGTGANQVTNPANAATYYLAIGGTSSMAGSIPMPIVTDDDSGVSLVVPDSDAGGGGGGGSGGGGGDTGDGSSTSDDSADDTASDTTDNSTGDATDDSSGDTTDDTSDKGSDDSTNDSSGSTDGSADGGSTDGGGGGDSGSGSAGGDSSDADSRSDSGSASGGGSSSESGSGSGDGSSGGSDNRRSIDTTVSTYDGDIVLGRDEDIDVLPGTDVRVRVEVEDEEDVSDVTVVVGDDAYMLIETTRGVWEGIVQTPASDATARIVIAYDDGEELEQAYDWDAQAPGQVYEIIDGNRVPVDGAVVIAYERDGNTLNQWDGTDYGQSNPVIVSSSGAFAWYVPNGSYTVSAGKSGYVDAQKKVVVSNGILNPQIELVREAEAVIVENIGDDEPKTAVGVAVKIVSDIAQTFTQDVSEAVEIINVVRDLPEVQTAAQVAKPVTVVAAATSVGVLATSFNLLNYLRYLFTAPLLFFARRRRQKFGTVYNGITKVPVDLAIVRLYSEQGRIVQTRVTDKEGRFFFKVAAGRYTLSVAKGGFVFPSQYMAGKSKDGKFLDVYTGGHIKVTDKQVLLTPNIPVDPDAAENLHTPKRLVMMRFLRVFQHVLALAGLTVAITVLFIQPTVLSLVLVFVHIFMYVATDILTRRLKKQKGWGIVRSKEGNMAVPNAVVRLFEPKYNKLIESTLTDGKGRYAFMVGPNEYYVTFEKPGFQTAEVRPIDYSDKKEPELISVDVQLEQDEQED